MKLQNRKPFIYSKTKKNIRLLVKHEDKWRYILWFNVSNDGSIYLGPGYKDIIMVQQGSKAREKPTTHISYDEGKYLTDKSLIEKAHLSYHASGELHFGTEILYGIPLRSLQKQILFCIIAFEHPYNYPIISHFRNSDIHLDCKIDENYPLQGKILVSTKYNWEKIKVPNFLSQTNTSFYYSRLDGITSLIYQVVIGNGPKMQWPTAGTHLAGIGSKTEVKFSLS